MRPNTHTFNDGFHEVTISEYSGHFTITTSHTPAENSSRHVQQLMRHPHQLQLHMHGVRQAPQATERHLWRGRVGDPPEELLRAVLRSNINPRRLREEDRQEMLDLLFPEGHPDTPTMRYFQ